MRLSELHVTLCEVRKRRGLAQRDIAEALNVEQATVSLYETGKRGIPLDLLDAWLQLLEINVTITPKECTPEKPAEETEQELETFNQMKIRRNYLIAEMRALMAQEVAREPGFHVADDETGEENFWPYSLFGNPHVGLLETRYDHPSQKFLAVEYTMDEVNVYKFLSGQESIDGESDQKWLKVNRIYFSEDDFLTLAGEWDQESIELRRVTLLRKKPEKPEQVEVVATEGFSIRSLLKIQENFERFTAITDSVEGGEAYRKMANELDAITQDLLDIALNNRLQNGAMNPEFIFWTDADREVVEIPLWNEQRSWYWVEEGVKWIDEELDFREIQLLSETSAHEELHVQRDEDGNRVIGLIGEGQQPAVFKSNANRPNVIYRVAMDVEGLNEDELAAYQSILSATAELK